MSSCNTSIPLKPPLWHWAPLWETRRRLRRRRRPIPTSPFSRLDELPPVKRSLGEEEEEEAALP